MTVIATRRNRLAVEIDPIDERIRRLCHKLAVAEGPEVQTLLNEFRAALREHSIRQGDGIDSVEPLALIFQVRLTRSMDPETKVRLAALNDLIRDEKDPNQLLQLVREVLRLYDEVDCQKRRVGFQPDSNPTEV